MNICANCKYVFIGSPLFNVYPYQHVVQYWQCKFGSHIDPVTGNTIIGSRLTKCHDQRAEVSFIENKCGPEGKHWEQP